jgi:hypothetical protein
MSPLEEIIFAPRTLVPQMFDGALPVIVMLPECVEIVEPFSKYAPQDAEPFPVSVMEPELVIADPVLKYKPPSVLARVPPVMEMSPPVDSTRASIVALALPLMTMFPLATIAPVGFTVVPPEIVIVPADAVSEPAPA